MPGQRDTEESHHQTCSTMPTMSEPSYGLLPTAGISSERKLVRSRIAILLYAAVTVIAMYEADGG